MLRMLFLSMMLLTVVTASADDAPLRESILHLQQAIQLTAIVVFVVLTCVAIGVIVFVRRIYSKMKDQKRIADELLRASQTQRHFMEKMSHEINTPMNAICGFAQIVCDPEMKDTLTDKELKEFNEIIRANTDLLTTLVEDILDVTDMQRGGYKLDIKPCSPNILAREAEMAEHYRCPAGVKMYVKSQIDDDIVINTDGRRVQQVIVNFLTNAIKHTKSGEIVVDISDKDYPGYIAFSVTDTGEGISAAKAEKILKDMENVTIFHETGGLGLTICHNIAQTLGGMLRIDTTYTKGARFIFILPMK